jgi:SAM-dependent methyltransferase
MARCLDLVTGVHRLSDEDVEAGFVRAAGGRPAIVSCFEHDYRDVEGRLADFAALVEKVAARYPDVPWRYAAPLEAVRGYVGAPPQRPLELDAAVHAGVVHVRASAPLFQAEPWLAVQIGDRVVQAKEGLLRLDELRWTWTPPAELAGWERLGVAGSTDLGVAAAIAIEPTDGPGSLFLRSVTGPSATDPRSVWAHSKYYVELSVARASGDADTTDAALQAAELLEPKVEPGMTVLDVGCAAGHLHRTLAPLGLDYHGIDVSRRAIEIGRIYGPDAGLPADRLRVLPVEQLPREEEYDVVVSLSTLLYLPMFHEPLEAMARAARRWLVVRGSFGDETQVQFLPDVLLEPGLETLRAYFNVYSRREVEAFLDGEGFAVAWVPDRRQRERFGGRPEVVGGVEIPYEFLVAERVAPPPTAAELLGPELTRIAEDWRRRRDSS